MVGASASASAKVDLSEEEGHGGNCTNKKLSYRGETARQLPTWRGLGPPAHPLRPLWLHLCI